MRRGIGLTVTVIAGLAAGGLVGTGPAEAATGDCTQFFDVNHDGNEDIAVGTPSEDVGRATDAGTVTIVYGNENGAFGRSDGRSYSAADVGLTSRAKNRFGAAVLVADLNGDHCGDLVIGAPGMDEGAGQVIVLYGTPRGASDPWGSQVQILRQGAAGAPGKAEAGDHFGASLAATGSSATGGPTQLWVGAPDEDISRPGPNANAAGMVTVYPTASGAELPTTGITSRSEGAGFSGTPRSGDRFGAALAGSAHTVLVGVPGRDIGKATNAGLFYSVVDAAAPRAWKQGRAVGTGAAEAGDRFGSSLAVVATCPGTEAWAVGAPGEKLGRATGAGQVVVYDRRTGKNRTLAQGAAGVPGTREAGDHFGASLVAADDRLAIGSPDEDLSRAKNAGSVVTLGLTCSGTSSKVTHAQNWHEGRVIGGKPTTQNRFGAALGSTRVLVSTAPQGRLLISIPGADEQTQHGPLVNSGVLLCLRASSTGFTATGRTRFGQNTSVGANKIPGVGETNDHFGSALSGTNPGY